MKIQPLGEYRGQTRPDFAITPGEGQESVWDYPRPPRIVADTRRVEVRSGGALISSIIAAFRILETASPPTFYCAVDGERVRPQPGGFYGGWVTDKIVGSVKGGPQTGLW